MQFHALRSVSAAHVSLRCKKACSCLHVVVVVWGWWEDLEDTGVCMFLGLIGCFLKIWETGSTLPSQALINKAKANLRGFMLPGEKDRCMVCSIFVCASLCVRALLG
jgi:hypothetical protein